MGKYIIYLRRNKVNGKCYVGQTSDIMQREYDWVSLKSKYANEYIRNDREKYGIDNWTIETLTEVDTREEAWELEQRFIKDFNTKWPNGYNMSNGGKTCKGNHLSEETRKKMSEARKGEKNGMYGKHHTEETIQKMSETKKGKRHSDETKRKISEALKCKQTEETRKKMKGKHHSEETRKKMSDARKGEKHPMYGKHHTEETKRKISDSKPKKQVYQYTLDDRLVKVWPSIRECGRNGFYRSNILKCCKGECKQHKGYSWSFVPL